MKAAFLDWLAPGATIFRNGPVNGPRVIEAEGDPPIVLDWRPVHVETSASGEMGLSTGPWRITKRGDVASAQRFGQFVSVWRRNSAGAWRVHVDLGIGHPEPILWDAPLSLAQAPAPSTSTLQSLEDAEADFAAHARNAGTAAAYSALGSESMRTYREGVGPILGRAAVLASSEIPAGPLEWSCDRTEASRAQDFGFAIGRFAAPGGKAAGHYLRIWRREEAGWRVALDITEALASK
jgi:ketosteroid isomerase-like protein